MRPANWGSLFHPDHVRHFVEWFAQLALTSRTNPRRPDGSRARTAARANCASRSRCRPASAPRRRSRVNYNGQFMLR